jgi:GlcNAc-PI de-N-acetylase
MPRRRSRRASEGSPPTGPLLVLSPHFDDAALSCAALLDRGEPVDVITIFGGEPDPPRQGWWDRRCGFASSAESFPVRRREEDAALGGAGHRARWLPLLEGQYVDGPRSEAERAAIREAVLEWSNANRGGTVAIPAGAGRKVGRIGSRMAALGPGWVGFIQHSDHVFVRDTVLALLAVAKTFTGLLYEELPYLWSGPAEREVRVSAVSWRFEADPSVLPVDRRRKAERIATYASQVPHLSSRRRRPDDPRSLPAFERYWRLFRREG